MRAGELTEEIIVKRPVKKDSDFSVDSVTYEDFIKTRAQVLHDKGSRGFVAGEIVNLIVKTFVIWIHHKVNEEMIIAYNGRLYRILDIDKDKRKMSITIKTEVINE